MEAPGEHSHTDARGGPLPGVPLRRASSEGVHPRCSVSPRCASPWGVPFEGTVASPRDTEQSLSSRPQGQGQCHTQGRRGGPGARGTAPYWVSALCSQPVSSAGGTGWFRGSDVATSPTSITVGPESLGRHSTGRQGCGQPPPDWRATAGDQEPWRFVLAAQGRVTPTATCPAPPLGALAIA